MRRAVLLASLLAYAAPLAAQVGSRLWRPEERVVLTDLSYVDAVAVSDDVLFVASRDGLAIYDRPFDRWLPPVTRLDGYPPEPVRAALVDPVDRSLWLGTDTRVLHYQPSLNRFESIAAPGGAVQLMFDRAQAFRGIYVLGRLGWGFILRGSFLLTEAPPLPPLGRRERTISVEEAFDLVPFMAARGRAALTDDRLRTYRYTAAAVSPTTQDVFFGTDGMGVLAVDRLTTDMVPLPFGLLATPARAVVAAPGGVWVGTGPIAPRVGLSFVSADLQEFRYEEGPRAVGFDFTVVRDLARRGRAVWAATDGGVVRLEPGGRPERMLTGFGTGADDALALAESEGGVWVATARGLMFIADDGDVTLVDERVREPIYALAAAGDTVWVGGRRGLGLTWEGSEAIFAPDMGELTLQLEEPIIAVTVAADTVVAATPERVLWRAPGAEWVVERLLTGDLGEITAVESDGEGVWVGGARGVAYFRPRFHDFRVFNAPGDVPGPVWALAVDQRYVWAATEAGLVRFEKRALIP
jgi:ligand-binding sensor domain-containing protein